MQKHIKSRIEANLEKNANKRAIRTRKNIYECLQDKFKAAEELKAKESAKSPDRSTAQKARRKRERDVAAYLNSQQISQIGNESLMSDNAVDNEIKIKLPYRLQQAFDEIAAENAFEESDFGRLMRNNN